MARNNILIISQHFPPEKSGNASRVYDLSKNMVELGAHVTVFSPFPSFPHGSFPRINKLRSNRIIDGIHHFKVWNWQPDFKDPTFPSRMAYYLLFPFLATIRALLNSKHFNVILTTAPPVFTGIPGYVIKKITGKKWLFDVRDLWLDASVALEFIKKNGFFYKLTRSYEKLCYTTCDEIVVTTNKVKEIIRTHYGIAEEKIHVIPNGVDTRTYHPIETEKKNQCIYAGNIGHAQDLEKVIFSIKKINEETDSKLQFLLVGDGDIKNRLQKIVNQQQCQDFVSFTGLVEREQIPALLSESLFGVAPLKDMETLAYAIPTKTYEYMACGIPFIATGRGEIEKIANESGAGLVATNDVDSIYEKIQYLLTHSEKRKQMGEQGRHFVTKYYDRKLIAQHLLELINS